MASRNTATIDSRPDSIFHVETADNGTVDVKDSDQTAVGHHRNHDFRRRRAVTGDVAGKLVDIGHNDRLALGRRSSAHALAQAQPGAGRLALKGADDKMSAPKEIEAYPIYLGQGVKHQGRGVGGIGKSIFLPLQQGAKFVRQSLVKFRFRGVILQ